MKNRTSLAAIAVVFAFAACGQKGKNDLNALMLAFLMPRSLPVNYLALGSNSAVSTDGSTWQPQLSTPLSEARSVACGNGKVVLTKGMPLPATPADQNLVAVSDDGKNWQINRKQESLPGGATDPSFDGPRNHVAFGNGVFALTAAGSFYHSEDGRQWIGSSGPFSAGPITFGNGKFVTQASCENGCPHYWSVDGISWTSYAIPAQIRASGLAFGGGNFVIVGRRSIGPNTAEFQALYSADAITWTSATFGSGNFNVGTDSEVHVVFGNNRFLAIAGQEAMFYSDDAGVTWNRLFWDTFDPNNVASIRFSDIAYGNGEFMGVGYSDSFDAAEPAVRLGCPGADGRPVQPGTTGERCRSIYTSKDGSTWSKVYDGMAPGARVNLSVARYIGDCVSVN